SKPVLSELLESDATWWPASRRLMKSVWCARRAEGIKSGFARSSQSSFGSAHEGCMRYPSEAHRAAPASFTKRDSATARESSYMRPAVSALPDRSTRTMVPDVPSTATLWMDEAGKPATAARHADTTARHHSWGSCS